MKPERVPVRPTFSSGPCAKRPGWSLENLAPALLGRSHRAGASKARIAEVIARSRAILDIPADYRIALVPASDTGALEMALWSLLGERGVEALAWDSFGQGWQDDIELHLGIANTRRISAPYGALPDLHDIDFDQDVVFTWNGTTSGVCVPDAEWIPRDREGLVICDATSAAFAMDVAFDKLDVATWSWQKVLGGEAAHGMLALSPRAVERLERYTPDRPLPKIFRLTKSGALDEALFEGSTINTPSMLCVEDALDGLRWAEAQGGLPGLVSRSRANLAAVARWVDSSDWIEFLATDAAVRSSTSICLSFAESIRQGRSQEELAAAAKAIARTLDAEGVAYDIEGYRDAPPGLRLWGGATVESDDLEALFPWLDWAWDQGAT